MIAPIGGFSDFCAALRTVGFSMASGRGAGGIALADYFSPDIRWHTGADTDPWAWRMRVLEEADDIAYAKVFLGKGGYITRPWYPDFLAVRRDGRTFDDFYSDGLLSQTARAIYRAVEAGGPIAYHEIKRAIGHKKADNARFESALIQLQMHMLLTVSGRTRRISQSGLPYGWEVTVFDTPERCLGADVFERAEDIARADAIQKIAARIRALCPDAGERAVFKFIAG